MSIELKREILCKILDYFSSCFDLTFIFLLSICEIAGEKFGGPKPTIILNSENAEIDELCVIRDGDHLFFLSGDNETLS